MRKISLGKIAPLWLGLFLFAATGATAAPAADAKIEPGRAIMNRACQTCHDLGTVEEAQHTAAQWPAVVQRMRANGAALTDAEVKEIAAYLAKTYAKSP